MRKLIAAIAAISLLASCSNSNNSTGTSSADSISSKGHSLVITIDGSSTVAPVSEAVAEDYGKANPDVRITVGVSGTGGGMKKFSNGEIDICDASRPMKTTEADACAQKNIKYIELPIGYDGIAIVVNPKNTWANKLTTAELKTIWDAGAQAKITNWNQVRAGFPDKPLRLFGPGTDNGTFDYFTEAINGKAGQSRGDYTASANPNILVQGIASDEGALGFFGLAYYENNKDKLKLIPVDDGNDSNGAGAILPSNETVQNGTYAPLSRVLFIYANTNAESKKEVKDFLTSYIQTVPKILQEVGYFPLQDELYPLVAQRLQNGVTGSIYTNGEEMGTNLGNLLKGTATASTPAKQ